MNYSQLVEYFEKVSQLLGRQVRFEHGWAGLINSEVDGEDSFYYPAILLNPPSWSDSVYDNEDVYEIDLYFLTNKYIDTTQKIVRPFAEAITELQILSKTYLLKLFDYANQVEIYGEEVLREATKPIIRPNEDSTTKGDYFLSIKFKVGTPKEQC